MKHGEWLLFNLNNDPYEQNNLAGDSSYASIQNDIYQKALSYVSQIQPFGGNKRDKCTEANSVKDGIWVTGCCAA